MASEVTPSCDSVYGYLRCNLPRDTIDIDLKIHSLRGIHTYKKDRGTQVNKYSPLGSNTTPLLSLKKKMTEFVRQREAATTPFNMSHQPQPKAAAAEKGHILVTLTKSSKDNQWQPRKVSVEPEPSPEPKP